MIDAADLVEISGYLFGAYGVGWCAGYLLRLFHKLMEMLK